MARQSSTKKRRESPEKKRARRGYWIGIVGTVGTLVGLAITCSPRSEPSTSTTIAPTMSQTVTVLPAAAASPPPAAPTVAATPPVKHKKARPSRDPDDVDPLADSPKLDRTPFKCVGDATIDHRDGQEQDLPKGIDYNFLCASSMGNNPTIRPLPMTHELMWNTTLKGDKHTVIACSCPTTK